MSLDQFSQYLSWVLYVLIFVLTTAQAIRRPIKANFDIALFFSLPALIIGLSLATSFGLLATSGILTATTTSLLIVMEYMLLRLVDDFSDVPRWQMRAWEASLVILVVAAFVFNQGEPRELALLQVLYILGLLAYTIWAFIRASRQTSGVTRRRMRAIAMGSLWLCVLFFLAGLSIFFKDSDAIFRPLTDLASVASGVSYFLGFATPTVLRRAWQEPELRAFLGRAASLPRLPSTTAIMEELELGAADSLGAKNAKIVLWNESKQQLWVMIEGVPEYVDMNVTLTARSFLTQKPVFTDNLQRDNPTQATLTRSRGAVALLAAPITAGEKRVGVLTVYSPRASIFADEDLELVKLLADQAAVILESRALIDEAARVQAREEATRMKDDFLSAAAHDLKTPLTTLVVQSELLERRAARSPEAPADLEGLRRMTKEVHRLKNFVLELLDAARAEQGRLLGMREEVDLVACSLEVCERHNSERHPCVVRADGPVGGMYDPNRIGQLLENLVENAVKYTPDGGSVEVRLWSGDGGRVTGDGASEATDGLTKIQKSSPSAHKSKIQNSNGWNHITVSDSGIGIPEEDLSGVFNRFHRGSNVDDRTFSGMGLGLFICKGIVEQHGGEIWVESRRVSSGNGTGTGNGKSDSNDLVRSIASNDIGGMDYGTKGSNSGEGSTGPGPVGTGNGSGTGTTFHVVLPLTPAPDTAAVAAQAGGE